MFSFWQGYSRLKAACSNAIDNLSNSILSFTTRIHLTYLALSLVVNGAISFRKFWNLNIRELNLLSNPNIYKLISNKQLSIDELEQLSEQQLNNILTPWVYELITNKHLTIAELQGLQQEHLAVLEYAPARELLEDKLVTLELLKRLTFKHNSIRLHKDPTHRMGTSDFYDNRSISDEVSITLSIWPYCALCDDQIINLIRSDKLSIEQLKNIGTGNLVILKLLSDYVANDHVTADEITQYTSLQCQYISNNNILQFIKQHPEQLANIRQFISDFPRDNYIDVHGLIVINKNIVISSDIWNDLNIYQRNLLVRYPEVCSLFAEARANGYSIWDQDANETEALKRMSFSTCMMLTFSHVRELLNVQPVILTFDQLQRLNHKYCNFILSHAENRQLLSERILTVEQLINTTYEEFNALNNADMRRRLLAREITIDHVIAEHHAGLFFNGNIGNNQINRNQSTHTASVHTSVSESALKLMQRYSARINESLENIIEELCSFVRSLPLLSVTDNNYDCVEPAQQAIVRITNPNYTFEDPASKVFTRQLLALAYTAIHDDALRIGTIEDAKASLVKGLRQAQREYNINETGTIDDGLDAVPACCAGTFNKIINSLQGVHPDCNIIFITPETIIAKLYIEIFNAVDAHLESLEQQERATLLEQISNAPIGNTTWDIIKNNVENNMLQEFTSERDKCVEILSYAESITLPAKYINMLRASLEAPRARSAFTPK